MMMVVESRSLAFGVAVVCKPFDSCCSWSLSGFL